jgi:hypothetical protein
MGRLGNLSHASGCGDIALGDWNDEGRFVDEEGKA